jgi:hypothetical protein
MEGGRKPVGSSFDRVYKGDGFSERNRIMNGFARRFLV